MVKEEVGSLGPKSRPRWKAKQRFSGSGIDESRFSRIVAPVPAEMDAMEENPSPRIPDV
jgi:hypothetical protein